MSEHILVIFPHPDDEVFTCSGTLAGYIHKGVPVTYICLTLGEMGRNMGKSIIANRESLPQIRKKELLNSCEAIGIKDLRLWGLRDKTVEFEDIDGLAGRIVSAIEEIQPSLIITFYPGYSVHPDHDACGLAVVEAVRKLPSVKRPPVQMAAFSKNCYEDLGKPNIVNPVDEYISQKMTAMKAHHSQFSAMVATMEPALAAKDPAITERLTKEKFWIYKF
ncbi:MAG TPA: bacillithiol biosynthesis deacetylase BshB2 [Bacillota bacterium]|nr:bacillithiol biosynthesis deacetylase BshB2 [Bacillota bacterium]